MSHKPDDLEIDIRALERAASLTPDQWQAFDRVVNKARAYLVAHRCLGIIASGESGDPVADATSSIYRAQDIASGKETT